MVTSWPNDPEEIIKARAAGMSLQDLPKRGYVGEFPPEKEMDPAALTVAGETSPEAIV